MTGPTDALANAMAEQLSELINDSPALNLKLLLRVYRPQNEKFSLCQSQPALSSVPKQTQNQHDNELVLLELLLNVQGDQ